MGFSQKIIELTETIFALFFLILIISSFILGVLLATPIGLGMLLAFSHEGIDISSQGFHPQKVGGIGGLVVAVIGVLSFLMHALWFGFGFFSVVAVYFDGNADLGIRPKDIGNSVGMVFEKIVCYPLWSTLGGVLVYLGFRIFI